MLAGGKTQLYPAFSHKNVFLKLHFDAERKVKVLTQTFICMLYISVHVLLIFVTFSLKANPDPKSFGLEGVFHLSTVRI